MLIQSSLQFNILQSKPRHCANTRSKIKGHDSSASKDVLQSPCHLVIPNPQQLAAVTAPLGWRSSSS
jgi:hypothetical protein